MYRKHTKIPARPGILLLVSVCSVLCFASCRNSGPPKVSEALPEAAFFRLCDAYEREDYEAIYGTFSSESKKMLRNARGAKIKNADDLRAHLSPRIEEFKRLARGAQIAVMIKMEDYAEGVARWSSGAQQRIWFKREEGIWRIDIGFDQEGIINPPEPEPETGETEPPRPRP